MRSAEAIQLKKAVFEEAPSTPRNLSVLATLDDALLLRGEIDAAIQASIDVIIPGDVLSVAPYDTWVWADGTAEHLYPDTDAPREEAEVLPTDEEGGK